jgi:hypothetical protein
MDCESLESALASISVSYGADVAAVSTFLSAFDLDQAYKTQDIDTTADVYLKGVFQSQFGLQTTALKSVFWFHLTRVPAVTDFAEGILPLSSSLDIVWHTITTIPKDKRIRRNLEMLRRDGVPDEQYNRKVGSRLDAGPYAMLVREAAFHPESMGNHDYLGLPEIIIDICNGYERQFGERIHEEIAAGLRKCIVKFETPIDAECDLIAPGLLYCWKTIHGQPPSLDSNTCFDGCGVPVPYGMIRNIEFL